MTTAPLRWNKAVLLAKAETTPDVDASPTGSANAIRVMNVRISFAPTIDQDREVSASLDPGDSIVGGIKATVAFDVFMKGSGTAGTPPEVGPLLKMSGWSETITAAAIPAAPEALASGVSGIQATLGATAAATVNLYRGMPVVFTGGIAGASFIYDYSAAKLAKLTDTLGGSLSTDTNYQIPVNVLYSLASGTIPNGTLYFYNDGTLWKFVGCQANSPIALNSGAAGKLSFSFSGVFIGTTDAAMVTPTYDGTQRQVWRNGVFTINSVAAALKALTFDPGSTITQPDDPNEIEGFGQAVITARTPRGQMDPLMTLVATRASVSHFQNMTKQPVHGRYGATAGNRVALTMPSCLYHNATPGDSGGGLTALTIPFHPTGEDAGAFLCFW